MRKENIWKYLLLGLMLLNVILISSLMLQRGGKHPAPKQAFLEKASQLMELDEMQAVEFKKLAKKHREEMRQIHENQRKEVIHYFESTEQESEAILLRIKEAESRKIETTSLHFKEVKELLRDDQMEQFQQFKKRALRSILHGGGKKPPPPRGKRP